MTIQIKNGNILQASENIITHQVNTIGVMGAGLAKQIKKQYPRVFTHYRDFSKAHYHNRTFLLGQCLVLHEDGRSPSISSVQQSDTFIANIYGQYDIGTKQKQTDELALRKGLETLHSFALLHQLSIAIPYKIGCGLAGGNWNTVYAIIQDVFNTFPHNVTIYKL